MQFACSLLVLTQPAAVRAQREITNVLSVLAPRSSRASLWIRRCASALAMKLFKVQRT